MRIALLAAAAATLLAAPASTAAPPVVKLATSTPTPVVDGPWRFTLTARSAQGKPLAAKAKLQLLVGTTVVGCWKGGAMVQCFGASPGDWVSFTGVRRGVLRFPAQSLGVTLTFRAIVKVQGTTRQVRAPVTVKPAP